MTKKSYSRRSYRRRRTNKKNKPTKLKSKKKSYKKGGMFKNMHQLATSVSSAEDAPVGIVGEGEDFGCADFKATQSLFEASAASKDFRLARIIKRPAAANATNFDMSLKRGDILELKSGKGKSERWFGMVESRNEGGVLLRWFKAIDATSVGLELDELQPKCDFNPFENIIGVLNF